jgi:hypothetical protein
MWFSIARNTSLVTIFMRFVIAFVCSASNQITKVSSMQADRRK